MKRSEGDSDFANKHQGRTIINNKDKLLLKYNKCLAHMWHADVPGSPRFYCPLPSYNSHPQRIGWLLPPPIPPTRLVPASLTVQSVVLVEGGGAAIEQWMELVQRRKRTDTGTLETMAACRGYSERLPPPLASTPPSPHAPQNCTRLSPAELISAVSCQTTALWRRKSFVSALGHQSRRWTKSGGDSLLARSSGLFGVFFSLLVGG